MGATARTADFTNVKEGGPRFTKKRVKAGDYLAKIVKVEDAQVKATKEFQYLFTIQLVKHPGATYPYYCQLTEKTLWKLRNLFIAAGKSVPKKKLKIDPNTIVGKTIGVTMEDAEYEEKEQSEIDAVFPSADLSEGDDDGDEDESDEDEEAEEEPDLDDEGDEEEEEADEEEADDEEAEDEGDEYDSLDRAGLKALLVKRDPTFQARKSQTEDDLRALLREGDNSDEADDDDEEEEEEPAPKPAKKKAKVEEKKAPAKKSKKKSADVSDEELEELDIDDL